MNLAVLGQVLSLYNWFALVVILSIYLLIARFYHRFSGKRVFFWFFTVPILLYGASWIRYASIEQITDDALGDVLGSAGGISLLLLCAHLYFHMTRDPTQ